MAKKMFALAAGVALAIGAGSAFADDPRVPSILETMDVASYQTLDTDQLKETIGTSAFADAYANAYADGSWFAATQTSTYTNASSQWWGSSASSSSSSNSAAW
jgi:hypothetical protein